MTSISTAADPRLDPGLNLAASWYVALPSRELSRRPKAIQLFGRSLVAWRDRSGHPVLMPRVCPHMGASLADGKLVDGCLQCPFHHWRFDASGACVEIPGVDRIPVRAHLPTFPAIDRHGYVWSWYGSAEPMFPLPDLPALAVGWPRQYRFRLADPTGTTVRRIMENAYDPDHLTALHGLEVEGPLGIRVLTDPGEIQDHGPPIAAEAWFGVELTWPRYTGKLGAITGLLGTNAGNFVLRIDGWPSGQRISYLADGVLQYRLLLATTPIAPNRTVQHIAVAVVATGRFWRDPLHYLMNRIEITVAAKQDLPVFDAIRFDDSRGVYVKRDVGVLRFRKYYQSWVDRVVGDA